MQDHRTAKRYVLGGGGGQGPEAREEFGTNVSSSLINIILWALYVRVHAEKTASSLCPPSWLHVASSNCIICS